MERIDERLLRLEQDADHVGTSARLPHELLHVALRFFHVVVGGEAYAEEGGREAFERVAIPLDEVHDVTFVFAYMDGCSDDHRFVALRRVASCQFFRVYRL